MGDKYLKKIFIKKPLYKEFYVNLQTIRVYKDLIISTIVDCYHGKQDIAWSIRT